MNRKDRRTQEAKNRNGTAPVVQKTAAPDDAANQRIEKLLQGDLEAPNQFVAYLVKQAKQARQDLAVLSNNIQQGEQQLAQMRQNALRLQGQVSKYIEDIRAWDKEVLDGGATAAKPDSEAGAKPEAAPA